MAIRLLIKKALKKNQIPLKGDEVGEVQKTDHMSLTAMENVFNLAHSMKSMSGALMRQQTDNSTYEYPQSSSSANSSLTVN
ncbi:hypothetical protein [Streptococcus thermophilus]|uniref:hypothetical protein n=1 Tax=Streptococcus thermophilus TaxID=1308 RepID=UPI003100CC00